MFSIKLLFSGKTTVEDKKEDKLFFDTFFVHSSFWFGQHALMCRSIPVKKFLASFRERIKSKLRTVRKCTHWNEVSKDRQILAIQTSGARELRSFFNVTFKLRRKTGNLGEILGRTKIAPFGRSDTCRVFEFLGYLLCSGRRLEIKCRDVRLHDY